VAGASRTDHRSGWPGGGYRRSPPRADRTSARSARGGAKTPWEVSADLFGSLSSIHILHGPGEAFAHLEHLEAAGVVSERGRAFEATRRDVDLGSLFPDVSGASGHDRPRQSDR